MKTIPMRTVKRDLNVVSLGLRNSIRSLFKWINSTPDKETTKRRLLVTVGVPAGFIIVGSEYPALSISGALLLFFVAVFWFARVEQTLVVEHTDFTGPFQIDGKVVDFPGLLSHLARKHPDASLQEIADVLHEDFCGPDLTDTQIASQMRLHRIRHQAAAAHSPTSGETPLSKDEPAGQDHEGIRPAENGAKAGSGKAWLVVTGLSNKARRYAGSSPKKEKEKDSGQDEEPSRRGVGEEQGLPDRGPAETQVGTPHDAHTQGVHEAPIPDPGGRKEGPGGVPDQGNRRDSASHEEVAQGA